MSLRTEAIDRLWFGQDPPTPMAKVRPAVLVEVGVWKGRSVLTIGRTWDGLERAVDEFAAARRPAVSEATFPRCVLQKALDAS